MKPAPSATGKPAAPPEDFALRLAAEDSSLPLHVRIERAIRSKITSGAWPAHYRLPAEPELAAYLGVNRGTLRRALATLTSHGLITAQRGRGTFVAPASGASAIAQRFLSLSEDLAAQGFSFTRNVVSATMGRMPVSVQTMLGVASSTPGIRLERVFAGTDGPLAYLVNYVRADLFPGIERVDFTKVSLFDTIGTTFGVRIERGRRTLSAQAANGAIADALHLPIGAPVLYVEQLSFTGNGDAIEYSDIWIDSSRVTVTSMLSR